MSTNTPTAWEETTLGSVVTLNYGKGLTAEVRTHGKVPVYGSSGITGWHNQALIEEGGIIVGRKGTVGAIYRAESPFFPIDTVFYITSKDTKCDLDYLYYLLLSLRLDQMNSDSAVPGLSRDFAYAKEILLPPPPDQRSIAGVLSSLDDKIELLHKQNETLEQIAQALFHEWFVKPTTNGELPEGWKILGLSEVAIFLNGIALQKFSAVPGEPSLPAIKIRELKAGVTDVTDRVSADVPEAYIVENGDLLFSWSGSLEVAFWRYGRGALNQHLFKVTSKEYPRWFVYLWLLHHLPNFRATAANKATTMGHIQRHHLDQAEVVVPDATIMSRANTLITPVLDRIILNNTQTEALTAARDALLPRLMSGELRVL